MKKYSLNGNEFRCTDNVNLERTYSLTQKKILLFADCIYNCIEPKKKSYVYEQLMDSVYDYFFKDFYIQDWHHKNKKYTLYETYVEYIKTGIAGKFHTGCILFLQKNGCIDDDLDIAYNLSDYYGIKRIINAFKLNTGSVLIPGNGKIFNGKIEYKTFLSEKMFYKLFLHTFYMLLEENGVVNYKEYIRSEIKKPQNIIIEDNNFTLDEVFKTNIINVYENLTKNCNTYKGHKFERKKVLVKDLFMDKEYYIFMDQCINCKQYFVHYNDIENRMKQGIYPKLKYNPTTKLGYGFSGTENKYSVLSLFGYNVKKNPKHTNWARQRIMNKLIENNIISAEEISNHLGYLIYKYKERGNYKEAVEKWNYDKDYIEKNYL